MSSWTPDQKNSKQKNRQLTPFDDQPTSSSRMNILGFTNESDFAQGKFPPPNHSISMMNVNPMMLSTLQLNETLPQSTVERRLPPSGQPSSSSILSNHHQNSHGNYVDIDAIDSILLQEARENDNNYLHYSTNNINATQNFDRNSTENHIQKLIDSTNSPIYENPSFLRPESPIYSNTHSQVPHSQASIASLYSKSQNIYSNLPAINSAAATSASYANLQQPHQHQVLTQSEYKYNSKYY